MSFVDTLAEARERFSEALQLLIALEAAENQRTGAASNTDKAMKGLALVAIYAAVERTINSAVEQAIYEISSHATPSASCLPSILSIFYFNRIQAIKDCSADNAIPRAIALISGTSSRDPVATAHNPLLQMLQNVDANTMLAVAGFFGIVGYTIPGPASGRLNNLRERRNAVSHGREAASLAGERFTIAELRNMYAYADTEATRFVEMLRVHCESRQYVVGAA